MDTDTQKLIQGLNEYGFDGDDIVDTHSLSESWIIFNIQQYGPMILEPAHNAMYEKLAEEGYIRIEWQPDTKFWSATEPGCYEGHPLINRAINGFMDDCDEQESLIQGFLNDCAGQEDEQW